MDFHTLSTDELIALFNTTFGKNVKKGSYTRAKLIAALSEVSKGPAPLALDFEAGSNEATPYPTPAAEEPTPSRKPKVEPEHTWENGFCPLCGGVPENQTSAGPEGTFLGDSCVFCHSCGGTWSVYNGERVEVKENGTPKKRRIINPQSKINAKVEACRTQKISAYYDKPTRLWTFVDLETGVLLLNLDSRTFSEYSPKELADYVQSRAAKALQ